MKEDDHKVTWRSFLTDFERALDVLADRVNAFAAAVDAGATGATLPHDSTSPVIEEPSRVVAKNGEILVGIGRWTTKDDVTDHVIPVTHGGICLQHKAAPATTGRRFGSLSEFVATAGGAIWQDWAAKAGGATAPADLLERFTLVVEDASPDSCFGLIVFMARLSGVPADEIPADWLDYVGRWEAGDVRSTGEAFSSWGALHTALSHSHIGGRAKTAESATKADRAMRDASFGRAWLACLRFDVAVLRSGVPAHDLSHARPSPEHFAASAFLNYEYQQYVQSFLHASCLQLLVPMTGAGERFKLVDACFQEEQIPLGASKVFLRNDREHTWLRDGYALMGLHKPSEQGSGNDMTVSVDPAASIQLEELWVELEQLEDEKWGDARPSSNPRPGIKQYPDGKRAGPENRNAPTEPWWDHHGLYTLIGAPRALPEGGPIGSKLNWSDVLDATWRVYNPLRFLRVRAAPDPDGAVCSLQDLVGSLHTPPGKRLVIAYWAEMPEQQSFLLSPTAKRYLAACAARQGSEAGPITFNDLPDEASFDFLALPGGLAIVHRDGVFLLDDWRNEDLNVAELRDEFHRVSDRLTMVDEVQRRLDELGEEIERFIAGRKRPPRKDFEILTDLSVLKIDIQRRMAKTSPHAKDPAVLSFREVLEGRWGVASKLETFDEAVGQLQTTLRDHSELHTNRIIRGLTIYGFPAVLLASFFQFVTTAFPTEVRFGDQTVHFTWVGVNWLGLVIYAALVVAAWLVLLWLEMRRRSGGAPSTDQ